VRLDKRVGNCGYGSVDQGQNPSCHSNVGSSAPILELFFIVVGKWRYRTSAAMAPKTGSYFSSNSAHRGVIRKPRLAWARRNQHKHSDDRRLAHILIPTLATLRTLA
jgi:hypothetical protein